jgi:KipI family sensor histidine kinase inhibitor
MGLRALGDSAWLFEAGGSDPRSRLELVLKLARILERERIPEVRDVVSSFTSVAVHFDPADGELVLSWLTNLPPPPPGFADASEVRSLEVPVVYGGEYGPDLTAVARAVGRSEEEVVKLHSGADYTVAAVGFSPGFPYLMGLPDELRLPRLATPRRLAAGSVAVAGNQAGIYPFESQGGWHVLGTTGLAMFDPYRREPSLLRPGDRVRFVPESRLDVAAKFHPAAFHCDKGVEIIDPGAFTTVQDLGRPGYQNLGVSPGGVADPVAARVANRLVGNPDGAAVLECCMTGPVLEFHEDTRVAFVGWSDGRAGTAMELKAGAGIDLRSPMISVRGCVAIAGGIEAPQLMGSRATDVRAGFGGWYGRKLQAGDRLPIGPMGGGLLHGDWRVGWPRMAARGRMIELRFVAGMQSSWFATDTRQLFARSVYQISPVSDRMGVRLDGPVLELAEPREMSSQPVVAGSVQIPPAGQPIVLLTERQTIGGYPQIGNVISADLPKLARAWPGTPLRFREVSLDEARAAWRDLERDFAFLHAGLEFLR